jgi:ubiquitin-protein ligase E3 C
VSDFSLDFTIADTFTTDFATGKTRTVTRELKPGGASIPVTNDNRLVYVSYVARHRLQAQPYRQTAAFLRGLSSIVQPSWLSMFNRAELQALVGGASASIDLADLRKHTQYGGTYVIGDDGQEHPTVRLFWAVMEEWGEPERAALLKFVTSTPRAPLLGFGALRPSFSIRDSGQDQTRLPSTSTCVNLLKLPMYTSKEVLREKLLTAVFSGAGFDLS